MTPLYVCTMVFTRHDLLRKLFSSCATSTRKPDGVYVVDHAYDARKIEAIQEALEGIPLEIVTIEDPGCARISGSCGLQRKTPPTRRGRFLPSGTLRPDPAVWWLTRASVFRRATQAICFSVISGEAAMDPFLLSSLKPMEPDLN